MRRSRVAVLSALALGFAPGNATADADEDRLRALEQRIDDLERDRAERIETLEARIVELEAQQPQPDTASADWSRYVRLSGSANASYYYGESDSPYDDTSFQIRDARFFVDAEIGRELRAGEQTILRNVGLSFEWDLVRLGMLQNDVGDLYVDLQGIFDSSWSNLQVGRFQIPVGEGYLRYGRGFWRNPFISNVVGAPWWWDEGVRAYGSDEGASFGYVASITAGETPFNVDLDGDSQYTLKLWVEPLPWLHLSASGLYSGGIGSSTQAALGAVWLGESWGRAFGSGTDVANYEDGMAVPDGPNAIASTYLVAGDAIVEIPERFRMWLGYGMYDIDSAGSSSADRRLQYWVAELLLYGGLLSPEIADVYLGLRANGLGTYDADEGYLLDFRYGSSLGYNMKSLNAYSVVVGWPVFRHLTLRAEYTHQEIDFVRGTPASIRRNGSNADYFGVDVGAHF